MKVIVAETAGFCFGVRRAVDKVYEQIEKQTGKGVPIYTYGPIIHNQEVIRDMEEKGVRVLHSRGELEGLKEGVIIIRSHGIGREIHDLIHEKGLACVDATCPFVTKIHRIVQEESVAGRHIIIIGNAAHPEVQGIVGWCASRVTVISSREEAAAFTSVDTTGISIVSQTTFNYNKFKELVEILLEKGYDIHVLNTICSATKERQLEAKKIAGSVDAMIVIGDKHSSNTQKLFEICREACVNTYYIQTLDDLELTRLRSVEKVGITAGASTPNNIIEEVQNNVRTDF